LGAILRRLIKLPSKLGVRRRVKNNRRESLWIRRLFHKACRSESQCANTMRKRGVPRYDDDSARCIYISHPRDQVETTLGSLLLFKAEIHHNHSGLVPMKQLKSPLHAR
jgi:hypothetical protein